MLGKVGEWIKREIFLVILIGIFGVLILLLHFPVEILERGVDWRTLGGLGLIVLFTQGVKESGFFTYLERRTLQIFTSRRQIGLGLLGSTFLLSPLLTNDITLLIVVPLTLQFGKILGNKLAPLVFLEAITANLGSGISPIGNPQNLYLYLNGGFGFWEFIKIMVLAMGIPMVGVLGIGWIVLGGGEGERVALSKGKEGVNRPLLLLSLVGIGGVIVGMELKMEWGIWIGVPFYLTLFPFLIKKVDWGILLLFLFIFLDCALLLQLPSLRFWIEGWGTSSTQLYWGTLFLSQLISNFPATILISSLHPSTPLPILYGADIGGNGTLISSLANLIALRYLGGGKNYLKFHLYSLPFLGVSGLWGVYLLGGI